MSRNRALLGSLWVLAALTACSGSPGQPARSATSAAPTTPATTSSSTTSPATSPTSTPATPKTSAPARSAASLTKALLALKDLPPGFSIEPPDKESSPEPTVSSRNAKCAALVKLTNAPKAPGSLASATVSFSGGQDGPFVDETLDALGSAAKVGALQARLKAAVATCSRLSMTIPGQGTSTMEVRAVSPPAVGSGPVAFRVTGIGGPLDGFEITQVSTGVGDALLSMAFLAALPEDVEGATELAHDKAAEVLGPSGTSTS